MCFKKNRDFEVVQTLIFENIRSNYQVETAVRRLGRHSLDYHEFRYIKYATNIDP